MEVIIMIYVSLDVILGNLLHNNDAGIDISILDEINYYITLQLKGNRFFYFDTSKSSIDDILDLYGDLFLRYQNKIYRKKSFNLEYFSKRYPMYINDAIRNVVAKVL